MQQRLDLIIFDATDSLGIKVVEEAVKICQQLPFTWAIAGRTESELNNVKKVITVKTDCPEMAEVKTIIANTNDLSSLKSMCSQAKVLVNCSSQHRLSGLPLIRACLESKTHHVDASEEPQFIEMMQLLYDMKAQRAGIYIISGCGFNSICNDMGTVFLQHNFDGTVNSVRSYLDLQVSIWQHQNIIQYETWASTINSVAEDEEVMRIRNKLYGELPILEPKLRSMDSIHKHHHTWCVPYPGADEFVVYRTQRHNHVTHKARPVQFKPYVKVGGLLTALLVLLYGQLLAFLSTIQYARDMLLLYPRWFSLGLVTSKNCGLITNSSQFSFTLYGDGWDRSVADVHSEPPNKQMVVKVSGDNPGYGVTVRTLVLSAITLTREADKMPSSGGVLTTGAAFSRTSLIDKLMKHDLKFEILH